LVVPDDPELLTEKVGGEVQASEMPTPKARAYLGQAYLSRREAEEEKGMGM
jgi:hypothetical protein